VGFCLVLRSRGGSEGSSSTGEVFIGDFGGCMGIGGTASHCNECRMSMSYVIIFIL
jgi:hypothetical protein